MKKTVLHFFLCLVFLLTNLVMTQPLWAQPVLETGSRKPMPNEWIDKDTHHKVIRLSRLDGNSESFYFHNNPFLEQSSNEGDRMVFYNTGINGKFCYSVNLKTLKIDQITDQNTPLSREVYAHNIHNGEIVGRKSHNIYYQQKSGCRLFTVSNSITYSLF